MSAIDHGWRIQNAIVELRQAVHEKYGTAIIVDFGGLETCVRKRTEQSQRPRGMPIQDVMRAEEAARREVGGQVRSA